MNVRSAEPSDVSAVLEMLRLSAEEQGFPESLVADEQNLLEDGFGSQPRFSCMLAEIDGAIAGMALYFFIYSTWISRKNLYLEDLFVRPEYRGRGVGRTLMSHLITLAQNEGCRRMVWMVHDANERAIRFYESLGAVALRDWIVMVVKERTSG
jgi:GNAT superfamily N-acetyltransferase